MKKIMLHIGGSKMNKKELEEKYKKIKELLKKERERSRYNKPYIRRKFSENINLRKTFLAVIRYNPALIHEISEFSLLSKPTCYSQLFNLMDMKLVERKYIKDCENGKDLEIIKKFDDFTSKMPEGLKNYYYGKTSFWKLTDYGKEFVEFAYEKDKEFKEQEEK